jgi:undecaprenyl diphosphate synthase
VHWIGRRKRLWKSVVDELDEAVELTKRNTKLNLVMCVNYGGQAELVDATREIAQQIMAKKITPEKITEKTILANLYEPKIPPVDLFIRTSGEQRTSNFLLWQAAYAELYFDDTMWPDYNRQNLWDAVLDYSNRNRRFGKA